MSLSTTLGKFKHSFPTHFLNLNIKDKTIVSISISQGCQKNKEEENITQCFRDKVSEIKKSRFNSWLCYF